MNSFHACSWTKRQRRNNKSAKLKEVQAWQNGTYIVGTWPEQQRELEKDQHKPHGYRPSECQVSVVNPRFALRSINKELIFFFHCAWLGRKKPDWQEKHPRHAMTPPGESSRSRLSHDDSSHFAVCAKLEPAVRSLMKHAQLFTEGVCTKVIFCLTWRRAGKPVLKWADGTSYR